MVHIFFIRKYKFLFCHERMPLIIFDEHLADKTRAERRPRYNPGWHIKRRSSRTIDSHEAKRRAAAVNWKYVKDNKTISHKT